MISKRKLYIEIGCARSGKSTIANKWANFALDIKNNQIVERGINLYGRPDLFTELPRAVVCSDDIRLALNGCRFNTLSEEFVHAIQQIMIRSLLSRNYDVLVDGTNTTLKSIKRLLTIDNNADYLIIDTPIEECFARALSTHQSELIPVIERMSLQLNEWKDDAESEINRLRREVRGYTERIVIV